MEAVVRDALRRAAALGPYFAVETDAAALDDPVWQTFSDLLAPEVVADRIGVVVSSLAARGGSAPEDIDRRAAASTYFLGLASRLLSPTLATLALEGVVLACPPVDLRWRADTGPVPIGWRSAVARDVADVATATRLLHEFVVDPLMGPLVAAFPDLSPILRWGNVASALAGAAAALSGTGSTLALDPVEILASALQIGPLKGTGSLDAADRFFQRANCCLIYRVPGYGMCGDCVLTACGTTA